jgi:replication factor C subunit 3/5
MSPLNENIPWVEKYRPTKFDDIVLDPSNRVIFNNILLNGYFPNLMFYGPPGTGKTTTIINLITEYNDRYNPACKGSVIHLNASDERGIDIIRNQIYQFVKSNNFFNKGLKFVILDEVDYMTKNAQHALKYLLQTTNYNVRYCLICNYSSKVDESLKNEFISIRFNQLPQQDIRAFIQNMIDGEKLDIKPETIDKIQHMYHSDIRSMINFIQLHQNYECMQSNIITNDIWKKMKEMLQNASCDELHTYIQHVSIQYNIDKKSIIKDYFNYILRNHPEEVDLAYLTSIEVILHATDINGVDMINYMKYTPINQLHP